MRHAPSGTTDAESGGESDEKTDRQLLRRLTGAWGTQALRAMVDLDIPDHLAEHPHTSKERRPAGLAAARPAPPANSMRHLAQLYGGLFYQSFSALPDAFRDDDTLPFAAVFGQPPWEYFKDHPQQGQLFNHAMAEGAFFSDVAAAVDFSRARTGADIGACAETANCSRTSATPTRT
ncbi:hypothetical protein ACH35V_34255 [Actinomadura sp. 1N219]|uniref:hypothetical protein n=1 Tax=Actinomadura sp. 1N219 TaxID=3375152 RepID=UPI0037B4FC06